MPSWPPLLALAPLSWSRWTRGLDDTHMLNARSFPNRTSPIEPGYRIQLPADWAEALGLQGHVVLEKTDAGILIRACPRATWDEIFTTKLTVRPVDTSTDLEIGETGGDDLLF
jgi:hypothetical protein